MKSRFALGLCSHIRLPMLTGMMMLVMMVPSHATVWHAGSGHTGDVFITIEGMSDNAVVWHCDGRRCTLDGPWGDDLSLVSCRRLVKKIGKVTYYGNNKGKLWSPVSKPKMLDRCNRGYDVEE